MTEVPDASPEAIQVVFAHPELLDAFKAWLESRHLCLFQIPVEEDDLPTFGVTFQ